MVYLEQLNSALYLDKREQVNDYMDTMDQLCVQAENTTATRRRLSALLEEI